MIAITEEEEKKGRTVVEVRWRDCFKFWVTGFILAILWGFLILGFFGPAIYHP